MLLEFLNINRSRRNRYLVASCCYSLLSFTLSGCAGYQNPPGKWVPIEASALYFSEVVLADDAVTSGYKDTCIDAIDEIKNELIKELPAHIAPLKLYTTEPSPDSETGSRTAVLKILITQCDIDVDQTGGNFYYYLSMSHSVNLTVDDKTLLNTPIKSTEQLQSDVPNPIYEFTFAGAIARTLLLFNGKQVWLANDAPAE